MSDFAKHIHESRARMLAGDTPVVQRKSAEEGGCGVVGFASNVRIKGKHIFRPSIQMHNRGNGKGGGIAACGFDPHYFGISRELLDSAYMLQVAFLDKGVVDELERDFVHSVFDVAHVHEDRPVADHREFGLDVRPPDVRRYFVRVREQVLKKFAGDFPGASLRDVEDEFVWRNSFKLNQKYYSSLGEKKAFVLSHARDLMVLKIVGYAENVVQYYGIGDMPANIWIAHQRYPTKGIVWHPGGAHPFIGMNEALVHNGDFANYHSVCEYLRQRNMMPQFLTDTEVSVMLFDLWRRVYKYPLEYVIEALAPTTELDFDRLTPRKQRIYGALQSTHIHGSPDGPWFFIIAGSAPEKGQRRLIGITDTSMLRPQVFALSDGAVQIGLCASEKQAIDAALESISEEDNRFSPVADRYWNARGGSHNDGGAFVFQVERGDDGDTLRCFNKFGEPVVGDPERKAFSLVSAAPAPENVDGMAEVPSMIASCDVNAAFEVLSPRFAESEFETLAGLCEAVSGGGRNGSTGAALDLLTMLLDRRYDTGMKKRSSVRLLLMHSIYSLLGSVPSMEDAGSGEHRRIEWKTRDQLRPPREDERVLVVDASGFPPEGDDCDSALAVRAAGMGWRRFVVYALRGQRFHGCGFGPGTDGIRVDLYGSSGDYAGSGMDGCELRVHGDAQDQLGQILKRGRLIVFGNVGQTFMYGSKGGHVYVMGSAAGRPLINTVGCPRVVINGTCLDFLAESFMAGDPLAGGGFVVVNGIEFADDGSIRALPLPYPGSNLFSLASGGALYIRDPRNTIVKQQLNGGHVVKLTDRDWDLILPHLEENEKLFGIRVKDLLTVDGVQLSPSRVYRKITPIQVGVLARELADEED